MQNAYDDNIKNTFLLMNSGQKDKGRSLGFDSWISKDRTDPRYQE